MAFYWVLEVVTTIGYGDYFGSTSNELIFSIALEFLGLVVVAFLMGPWPPRPSKCCPVRSKRMRPSPLSRPGPIIV